jgi:hypothetical protein
MKKFLHNLALFSIPLLLYCIAVEYYCHTSTTFIVKKKYLEKNKDKIETLIFGSSHFQNGINPQYLTKKAANISFGGQPMSIDYLLLERYCDEMKNLRTIIFEISPHRFYHDLNPQEWNGHIYSIAYNIDYKTEKISAKNYSYLAADFKYFSTIFFDNFSSSSTKPKLNEYGFILNDFNDRFSKLNYDSLKINTTFKINTKYENQKNVKRNTGFLNKVVQRCKEKNIKILFVTSPFYQTYVKSIPLHAKKQVHDIVHDISIQNNVPFYDYSNSEVFTTRDFKNDNHLNPDGAKKFTQIIDKLLIDK